MNNGRALLTDEDVVKIRIAYNNHERRKDVYREFENKISFATFSNIWDGATWKHIMPEVFTEENKIYYSRLSTNGEKSPKALFSNDEVISLRKRYVHESAREIY